MFHLVLDPLEGASAPFREAADAIERSSIVSLGFPGFLISVEPNSGGEAAPRVVLEPEQRPGYRIEGPVRQLLRPPSEGDAAGQTAEALAHWRRCYPHATIELGPAASALAAADPGALALQGGCLLAGTRRGGLLVQGGTPGASADAPLPLRSISKAFAALVVLALHRRGALSLDAHLSAYLPCFAAPELAAREGLTLRALMCHTAGVAGDMDTPAMLDPSITLEDAAALVAAAPLVAEPGTKFRYSNPGFQVVGAVVEAVTGLSWHEAFEREVAAPLGLASTRWVNTSGGGVRPRNPNLASGCISTPSDLAAFAQALAARGRGSTAAPSPPAAVEGAAGGALDAAAWGEMFAEQSRGGDGGDRVWGSLHLPGGKPNHAMQQLLDAGLLTQHEADLTCDLWGDLSYGLGIWRGRSRGSGALHVACLGAFGMYVAVHDAESDDPQWVVWTCTSGHITCVPAAGALLTDAAARAWGPAARAAAR